MAAQLGKNFLLSIYNGATYDDIVQCRATDMTINNESVDITNKGSAGWRTLLQGAGISSMTITIEGVYEDSTHEEDLVTLAVNNTHDLFELTSGTGDKFAGTFQVTSYGRSGTYNGEEAFTATLESAGVVTYTAI